MPQANETGRRPPAERTRDMALALATAAVVVALLLGRGGIWDHVGGRDTHATFVSRYEVAPRALASGRLPLWNPDEFCGTPLLGSTQGAMLYPPVVLLFALLPPRAAMQGLYGIHAALFVWATIVYARRKGVSRLAAPLAPLIGLAGLFTGLGYTGIDHPSFLMALAWIPAMLIGWEDAVHGSLRGLGLLALGYAAQWLAGSPEFPIDTPVLLGVVAVLGREGSLARRLGVLAAGLALGAALASVQILALDETVAESLRPEHQMNFHDFRVKLLRVHGLADLERTPAKASFAPAIALAALALAGRRRESVAWAVAFLWSVMPLNVPFVLLYHLPPWTGSRAPFGWGGIGPLFLGLLAASGLDAGFRGARRWLRIPAVVLGLACAAYATFVVWRAPVLLATPAPDYPLLARRADALHALMAAQSPRPRVIAAEEVDAGGMLRDDLPSPTGYEPSLPPRRIVHLLKAVDLHESPGWGTWPGVAARPALARLLGIGVAVTHLPGVAALEAAGFTRQGDLPPADVVLVQPALPRARLVHRAVVVADEAESLAHVVAHAGEAATAAVVERGVAVPSLAEPPGRAVESATIAVDEPERVAIDVAAASPGLLVLTDTFHPGWEATVDGAPAAILRVDHAFRAVGVAAGPHRVTFVYRPRSMWLGLPIGGAAAFVVVGLLAGGRRRARG
jgi:hypothetical protein